MDRGVVKDFERIERGMMINKDGFEHLRLRRLVQYAFAPDRLNAARPTIQKAVDGPPPIGTCISVSPNVQ